jgi:dTDP-4-dehydrorhamnose reductase
MRILITGASGLLGLNLALEAARIRQPGGPANGGQAHLVTGVVNSHPLRTEEFEVIIADLLLPGRVDRLLAEVKPDWVINCAALALVDACEANPKLAYRLNVELPEKLAMHVARGGARLVHLSTDAVFDGRRGNYTEGDLPNPLSVYACTKLAGEQAVMEANPQAIIARVNMFGWSLSGKRSLAEWFFYNLHAGRPLQGFTDVCFCPLLVNDLAHFLLKMLETGLKGLYHVVSSDCLSKYNFGISLARRFSFDGNLIAPVSVSQGNLLAARSPNLTLSSARLAHDLGTSLPTVSNGLDRFYTLYQQGYPQYISGMAFEKDES